MANETDIVVNVEEDKELLVEGETMEELKDADVSKEQTTQDETQEELPEKFRGKTAAEIARSYSELESELGKKGNEVHELRSTIDTFLKQQLNSPKPSDVETEDELDFDKFIQDPQKVIDSRVKSQVEKIDQKLQEIEKASSLREFQQKHPDYQDVGKNDDFLKWVNAHPVRAERFNDANNNFNFGAADELLSEWKERQELLKSINTEEDEQRKKEDLKAAAAESGSTGEASPKFYRRADLVRLRVERPREWEARQEEFMKAYREGRVK